MQRKRHYDCRWHHGAPREPEQKPSRLYRVRYEHQQEQGEPFGLNLDLMHCVVRYGSFHSLSIGTRLISILVVTADSGFFPSCAIHPCRVATNVQVADEATFAYASLIMTNKLDEVRRPLRVLPAASLTYSTAI